MKAFAPIIKNPTPVLNSNFVVHHITKARGKALLDTLPGFDDDFIALLEEEYKCQPVMQDREDI